ncbi:MAG: RtcB family protein [Dethiobacter sp.]|jgi:tRNA-splicing ligase RtcB|nr:MAG: RtcB family protein [Dethiobacter sp.]
MRVIYEGRLPLKSWADTLEAGALQQARNLANLSFAFSHIALMPDVHEGYGMPIGGVLATTGGFIIPNAVGVDIGCGVVALQTGAATVTTEQVRQVLARARELIPVGFQHHRHPQPWDGFAAAPQLPIIRQELASARRQLGTLGGGNHFCSMERGSDGHIWLLVHSGSRNIGLKVASYYNKLAKKINKKKKVVPPEYDLAPLNLEEESGQEYFRAMQFCLDFARANRELLAHRFSEVFAGAVPAGEVEYRVEIHHNYAAQENHYGQDVVVHRKGAIRARAGERGIIPGSMGTPSYIVEGLGNEESFASASHGAGRAMSRREANQVITEEMANAAMQGIICTPWNSDYAEAPMAYKDIETVMDCQRDLVRLLVKLQPLGVMKG